MKTLHESIIILSNNFKDLTFIKSSKIQKFNKLQKPIKKSFDFPRNHNEMAFQVVKRGEGNIIVRSIAINMSYSLKKIV